jgi:hypothetical protein
MLPCQGKCDQSYAFVPLKATPHKDKSLTIVIFLPNSVVILARISSKSRVQPGGAQQRRGLFPYKSQKVPLLSQEKRVCVFHGNKIGLYFALKSTKKRMEMKMITTVDNMFFSLQWTDILSSQFFSDRVPAGEEANELVLQWAVFTDGLQRYSTLAADADTHLSEEFCEEEAWLLDNDREWPFSFVNLCETFGFQTDSLRVSLLARKESHRTNGTAAEHRKKTLRGFPQM